MDSIFAMRLGNQQLDCFSSYIPCRTTSSRGLARIEASRQTRIKEVVISLACLGVRNDMCASKIRSRKSSFEMNKVSPSGIQLESWGPRPFIYQGFVSLACILGNPFHCAFSAR